jgi:hypothetical protein
MLTGEFDHETLNFNSVSIVSHLIFILFVLLAAIILLNVLTGLAVSDISDTQAMRSDWELYYIITQVKIGSEIELMLLGASCIHLPARIKRLFGKMLLVLCHLKNYDYKCKISLNDSVKMYPDLMSIHLNSRFKMIFEISKLFTNFNKIVNDAREIVTEMEMADEDTWNEMYKFSVKLEQIMSQLNRNNSTLENKLPQ